MIVNDVGMKIRKLAVKKFKITIHGKYCICVPGMVDMGRQQINNILSRKQI